MAERIGPHTLHHGDCLDVLRAMPDNSIDAVVTDPPYGLGKPPPIRKLLRAWLADEDHDHLAGTGGFMGREWDAMVPHPAIWTECCRVLKPGGHLIAFAGQRTMDLMGLGLRLGGFTLRDSGAWAFWSGFPKSLDVSKAIDRAAGAERQRVRPVAIPRGQRNGTNALGGGWQDSPWETAPATDDAKRWEGWGTALKPALEPFWLARKPLAATVAANVLEWGTGGLNIDACRYPYGDPAWPGPQDGDGGWGGGGSSLHNGGLSRDGGEARPSDGRWPANIYYCPKASRAEREAGLSGVNMLCSCKPKEDAWASEDRSQSTDCQRGPSAGPGTIVSTEMVGSSWRTAGSGSNTTDVQCQTATTSTTSTGTSSTTGSKTSNASARSTTSASIQGASDEEASGGSPALSATNSSPLGQSTGTCGEISHSTGDAVRVTSERSSSPNVCDDCGRWKRHPLASDVLGRKTGSAGLNSPRTGAGRTRHLIWCSHPTVKPLALMRWLVRLVTPPGGVVLDPFTGSGTTLCAAALEGFTAHGCEREAEYLPIIRARLNHWRTLDPHEERPPSADPQVRLF